MKKGQLDSHILVLVTLGLTAFGLVMVYSATSAPAALGGGDPVFYLKREAIYALIGVTLLMVGSRTDYRALRFLAPVLMLTSLGLCAAVLVLGQEVNGARRWLGVGSLSFQPSELAKLSLAIWAAAYLARRPAPRTLKELARPIGLTAGLFAGLILLEPDLGTVIAIGIVLGAILIVSGTPLRVLAGGGAIAFGLAMAAIWIEPYRRARFFSFLDPGHDPQGAGYQTLQGILGLGSGGWLGTGLGQGVAKAQLSARGAHGHDLRDDRRGARPARRDAHDRRLRRVCLRGPADRPALPRSVRQAARGRPDDARLRPGPDQSRRGARSRSVDRNHAPVRLVRRLEPRCLARLGGRPP